MAQQKRGYGPSDKLVNFAKMISDELGVDIPGEVISDTHALIDWINQQSKDMPKDSDNKIIFKASMSQISFAEKLAQNGGIDIPEECYNNRKLMSEWIDGHKHLQLSGRPTEKMVNLANKIYNKLTQDGKEVQDPAAFAEDFEGMKSWIDANFPAEWRRQ